MGYGSANTGYAAYGADYTPLFTAIIVWSSVDSTNEIQAQSSKYEIHIRNLYQ
jgi:hypothetical protein